MGHSSQTGWDAAERKGVRLRRFLIRLCPTVSVPSLGGMSLLWFLAHASPRNLPLTLFFFFFLFAVGIALNNAESFSGVVIRVSLTSALSSFHSLHCESLVFLARHSGTAMPWTHPKCVIHVGVWYFLSAGDNIFCCSYQNWRIVFVVHLFL